MKNLDRFPLKNIIISKCFAESKPAGWKVQLKTEHFEQTQELPGTIVINSDNILIDGYITYLIAAENGFEYVPVTVTPVEVIEAVHRERGKAYFWKVPMKLMGKIVPGARCMVRVGEKGFKKVTVKNILQQEFPTQEPRLRDVVRLA